MKIERLFIYCLLASTSLLASCSSEEMMDSHSKGTPLPEGMYPITFSATQMEVTPQTRVTDYDEGDKHKSKWSTGDQIKVIVSKDYESASTICTLNAGGSINTYSPQLYWQTTGNHTINAWYSNINGQSTDDKTVDLSNQQNGLAYVLKAKQIENANYQSENIKLNFEHQLAKVRVKLERGTYKGALNNATVKAKGYQSCTVTNGSVSFGSNEGYIPMHKNGEYHEANLVPGMTFQDEAFEINTDGKSTKANLNSTVTLAAGNIYTLTIKMDAEGPEEITGGEITEPGDYIMTGKITKTVTLNSNGINLTLKDVEVSVTDKNVPAIDITGGSTVIHVEGMNTLSSSTFGGITMSGNANLTITSDDKNTNSLTVTASNNPSWDAASCVGIGAKNNGTCGNITISNVTLNVTAGGNAAAAIGTSGESSSSYSKSQCGDITIIDAIVTAIGGGGAAIGTGSSKYSDSGNSLTCGNIKITNSTVNVTINGGSVAGIGLGSSSNLTVQCGKIILDISEKDLGTFTSNWTGKSNGFKIGKGFGGNAVTFGGLYLNGQDQTLFNANGWGSW